MTSQVPESNAFNHLGRAVVVAYDLSRDFGPVLDGGPTDTFAISTGLKGVLPHGWQIIMSAQYARLREEAAYYQSKSTTTPFQPR